MQMKIWQCYSGITAQTWYYTGDDRIALQNQGKTPILCSLCVLLTCFVTGQCLDLTNGSKNDGQVMQTWACTTGDNNQVWTLS